MKNISLYFTEGSSDKEYHVQLNKTDDGYVVNFQYGRRGSALTSGTKTAQPVELAKAEKIYDKLVSEKMAKGYTESCSGVAFQGYANAGIKTDFQPQLLNPISEDEALRLIVDDEWCAQEKMDGQRRAAHAADGQAIGMNRKGLAVPLPQPLVDELLRIADKGIRVDGEIIGNTLHVFDVHILDGESLLGALGWHDRMLKAQRLSGEYLKTVFIAANSTEKRDLWEKVKANKGEGIVFKRKNALYAAGRPNSGGNWLKYKFIERASCLVLQINDGKRSVQLGLHDETGQVISVGNVTIPSNFDIPVSGDIVDVEYLYAFQGGSIYQPVYHGKRDDIEANACVLTQLKYKPNVERDDDNEEKMHKNLFAS